jgi:winged helix DNA-binding protein
MADGTGRRGTAAVTVAARRLSRQFISHTGPQRPEAIVKRLGAIQAQEFEPALWGVGLRMRDGATATHVERAFTDGRILRTHVMRPTWHFVARDDIRWMQALTAPRVQRIAASYNRRLELDARTLTRALRIFERALRGERFLTRLELADVLRHDGLTVTGQRLAHVTMHAELEAVICSGPKRGNRSTYALIAERAPKAPLLSRDEALATLSRRFFESHGPATIRDFVWWSGLTTADAKRGLEINRARREEINGLAYWTVGSSPRSAPRDACAHLLPIYDEYLVAYRDRQAVPHWPAGSTPGRGLLAFQHAVVIDAHVAGTWRLEQNHTVNVVPLRQFTARESRAVADAVHRYERFRQPVMA